MSFSSKNKKEKSGSSAGWGILLATLIGAGVGFLASKLSQDDKPKVTNTSSYQNKKSQKQSKIQINKTTVQNYDNYQQLMTCPITHEIMLQPHILTQCGHSFDKNFITQWVKKSGSCPLCKTPVNQSQIKVNYHLKQIIHYYQYTKNNTTQNKK